jgi:hypothetical protein
MLQRSARGSGGARGDSQFRPRILQSIHPRARFQPRSPPRLSNPPCPSLFRALWFPRGGNRRCAQEDAAVGREFPLLDLWAMSSSGSGGGGHAPGEKLGAPSFAEVVKMGAASSTTRRSSPAVCAEPALCQKSPCLQVIGSGRVEEMRMGSQDADPRSSSSSARKRRPKYASIRCLCRLLQFWASC